MNRLANTANEYQGTFKKVLCVCSAGLLRSPTAALVLSQEPFNFNTRAAGVSTEYALILVDEFLIKWADEIVCMNETQKDILKFIIHKDITTPVYVLDVPDDYQYRDPELMKLIAECYIEVTSRPKEPIITRD
jgi:predicted protein tyrosine phosphatase